ncbi:hypothetical protein HY522_01095 [bacterium]|nr:hypothetical protein [bacterium]
MGKLKELFFKINAKVPLVRILIFVSLAGIVVAGYLLIDPFTFDPDFFVLYGLEDARKVRARVEEQMRRIKHRDPPAPAPPAQKSYAVRILQQHNPFLPPGMIEQTGIRDEEEKFTDVSGIELVGTVYSHTPTRRTALIEFNNVAIVVREGSSIRGTRKKVVEIGRSFIKVQEEGLIPSPVALPFEHGLADLSQSLKNNVYKTQSNWKYSTKRPAPVVKGEDEEEEAPVEAAGDAKKSQKKGSGRKKKTDEAEDEGDEDAGAGDDGLGGDAGGDGGGDGGGDAGGDGGDGMDFGGDF